MRVAGNRWVVIGPRSNLTKFNASKANSDPAQYSVHPRRNKTALSYPLCPLLCLGRDPSQAAELQGHQDLPPTPVLVYLTDALPEPLSPGFYLGELLKGSCGFGQDVSRAPWSDPHQIPTTKGSLVPAGSSFLEEGLGPEPRRLRGGGRGILNTCPVLNYLENLGKLVLGHTTTHPARRGA